VASRVTWLTADFENKVTLIKSCHIVRHWNFWQPWIMSLAAEMRPAFGPGVLLPSSGLRSCWWMQLFSPKGWYLWTNLHVNQTGGVFLGFRSIVCACVGACVLAVCCFNFEVVMELLLTRLFDWRFLTLWQHSLHFSLATPPEIQFYTRELLREKLTAAQAAAAAASGHPARHSNSIQFVSSLRQQYLLVSRRTSVGSFCTSTDVSYVFAFRFI